MAIRLRACFRRNHVRRTLRAAPLPRLPLRRRLRHHATPTRLAAIRRVDLRPPHVSARPPRRVLSALSRPMAGRPLPLDPTPLAPSTATLLIASRATGAKASPSGPRTTPPPIAHSPPLSAASPASTPAPSSSPSTSTTATKSTTGPGSTPFR